MRQSKLATPRGTFTESVSISIGLLELSSRVEEAGELSLNSLGLLEDVPCADKDLRMRIGPLLETSGPHPVEFLAYQRGREQTFGS